MARIEAEPYGDMLPSLPATNWRIGTAHAVSGRTAEARAAFEQALTLDPEYEQAGESLRDLQKQARR